MGEEASKRGGSNTLTPLVLRMNTNPYVGLMNTRLCCFNAFLC